MAALAAEHLLPREKRRDIDLGPTECRRRTPRWSRRRRRGLGGRGIHSPSGTRTPLVVPFQVTSTSFDRRPDRDRAVARNRARRIVGASWSCLATVVTHPRRNFPGQRGDGARVRAWSTSPSRRRRSGRSPGRCRCGGCRSWSSSRISRCCTASGGLADFARCERPSRFGAVLSGDQPGGSRRDREEKNGRAGLRAGRVSSVCILPCRELAGVGTAWPAGGPKDRRSIAKDDCGCGCNTRRTRRILKRFRPCFMN